MSALQSLHGGTIRLYSLITDWGGSLLNLAIRVYVGWQFFKAGLTKIGDWESTLSLFRHEYSVPLLPPDLAAVAGTAGELAFPVLLFVGLLSRPAAVGLFVVNVMAVIGYPALFDFPCPAAINDHIFWGVLLLVVVTYGPGRLSLDHVIGRRLA